MIVQCLECGHVGPTKDKAEIEVCECCEGTEYERADSEVPLTQLRFTGND